MFKVSFIFASSVPQMPLLLLDFCSKLFPCYQSHRWLWESSPIFSLSCPGTRKQLCYPSSFWLLRTGLFAFFNPYLKQRLSESRHYGFALSFFTFVFQGILNCPVSVLIIAFVTGTYKLGEDYYSRNYVLVIVLCSIAVKTRCDPSNLEKKTFN